MDISEIRMHKTAKVKNSEKIISKHYDYVEPGGGKGGLSQGEIRCAARSRTAG